MFPQAFLVLQSRFHLILKDLGPYFLIKKASQSFISLFFMTHFINIKSKRTLSIPFHYKPMVQVFLDGSGVDEEQVRGQ